MATPAKIIKRRPGPTPYARPDLSRQRFCDDGELWRPDKLMKCARALARRLARRHDLSESDQDELVSDVLLVAVEKDRQGWRWGTHALQLHLRSAYRRLLSRQRERPVDKVRTAPAPSHENVVLDLVALQQAWPSLTGKERAALFLRMQGLHLDEIGEETGGNEATAGFALQRVRKAANGERRVKAKLPLPPRRVATGFCAACEKPISPDPSKRTGPPRVVCDLKCQRKVARIRMAQRSAMAIAALDYESKQVTLVRAEG